jgi:hypothetical protein
MTVSRHCFFDDAPWLAGGGQRLVHADIPKQVAEALGCQSLRYHHQVWTIPMELASPMPGVDCCAGYWVWNSRQGLVHVVMVRM